jgi:hypothetical protein
MTPLPLDRRVTAMTDDDGFPSSQQALERYPSLAAFYKSDPDRLSSRELDVGLWWREESDGPLHRAAWVSDTGELYLVRLGPTSQGGGTVEVLASMSDSDQLERLMAGWREHCGEPRSLGWLRERTGRPRRRAVQTLRAPGKRSSASSGICSQATAESRNCL